VVGPVDRRPRDPLVRLLLGDRRVPLLVPAADLGHPMDGRVVELADGLHPFHEPRERLELRPLVVRGPDRNGDIDGFEELGHRLALLRGRRIGTPTWAGGRPGISGGRRAAAPEVVGQIAPRPVRVRPVTALTTTTTMIAPITETTIELRSSGPSIGWVLNRTL